MKTLLIAGALALACAGAEWRVTCDYHYLDTRGNPRRRESISALYRQDEAGIEWKDVRITGSGGAPTQRAFMEGFRYSRAAVKDMLTPGFFRGFPETAMRERNLVLDTHMLEGFCREHFPHLKPGATFSVPAGTVALAGAGNFQLKNLQLTWTGMARRHGRKCALIDYSAFLNTLDMQLPGLHMNAGSHFWGQIWLAPKTGRIEHGTLYEAVVGEVTLPDQPHPQPVNIFRAGTWEPVGKVE